MKKGLFALALGTFFCEVGGVGHHYPALIGVPMALIGALCLLMFHRKYE